MKVRIKYLLKKCKFLYIIVTCWKNEELREAILQYLITCKLKKTRKVRRQEIKLITKYWDCPPYHYYLYKLYQKELTEDQLLDYIPPFIYYDVYWEKRNNLLNRSVYENKRFQNQLFEKLGIPTLRIIATIKNNCLFNNNNEPITIDELCDKYIQSDKDALVLKPENGKAGKGIIFLSKRNNILCLNSKPMNDRNIMPFLIKGEDYLIQERFIQSRKMSAINESSVNTLRIYTQVRGDEVVLPACVLRMGVNNTVDNFCQGGLMIAVDIDNGTLAEYALSKKGSGKYFEHPVSRYIFKNSQIDNWREIKDQIIRYGYLLRECKDLGWDVAIGEDGIKVLEINVQHGLFVQNVIGGMRKILGVYPEDFTLV